MKTTADNTRQLGDMSAFAIPQLASDYPARGLNLSVVATVPVDDAELTSLRESIGAKLPAHAECQQQLEMSGELADLRAFIGIHEGEKAANADLFDEIYQEPWVHYDVRLRMTNRPLRSRDRDWDKFSSAVADVIGMHEATISASWQLPRVRTNFAVALPINLGEADIPGFSEIRGVRLAEPDPDNEQDELYSMILNLFADVAVVQIKSKIATALDAKLLRSAMERALTISSLAVEYEGSDEDGS